MSYDDVRKQLMQATYQKNTGSQATQAKSSASTPAPARSSGYDEVYAQLESSLGSDARLRDDRNRAGQASGRNSLEEKYGTIDEIRALDEQQDSFKRFSLGAGAVAKYLQSDNWDDNNNHQWYSDLVSSRQQEIADAMAAAGDNRALKSRLQQYADAYGNLAQGLADRQSFFGQFQGKADYNSYASAVKAARSTKASGKSYDDWYQQANADIETASGRVTELEYRLANATLQASTGMWDENGVYLGEDKAAADEARRLKAELERARQDEADKRRIGSYAKAWRYQDLPETKGFRSAAAEGLRKFAADSAAERSRQQEQRAQREAEFNALGTGGLVYEDDLMTQLREDTAWREPAEDWTEQERNTFGYLYAQDPERAYEYGQYINDRNKAQTRYEQEQKVGDWATKNFGTGAASFAAGILTMPAALADYLDYAAEYAARGTVTQREYMSLADYGNVMVGAVSQGLNERYGTVDSKIIGGFGWGDVYQLGVSIGQSMLWGGAGKALGGAVGLAGEAAAHFGSTATLGMFFGSAAKSGFEDARAQGVDDGKALWYGFASGIAEAGCEVLSLDKLLTIKSPTSLTKLLKNVLVQSGVEASEELATTICNRISDQLINGDKSEISTKIALGMAKGMSYEEAAKEAEKEWLQSAAADALGGFLSGGISGGMASGFESLGRYRGNTEQLIDQGLASGGEAEAIARDMQDWMKRGETVTTTPQSAAQTAPLAQGSQSEQSSQTQERESEEPKKNSRTRRISNLQAQRLIEAIEETDRSKLKNAVEIRLQEMQESVNEPGKNLSLIAEAVAKSVQGDKLNRVEEEALKNSHFGEHLIHELSAEKLMTGGSIPEWVRNIGAERLGGGLYSDTETQAENLKVEPTEEQKKQNRTETMRGILSRSSEAAGVQMTDEEATAIAEGYEAGTNGRLYAAAATDAYKLGKSGKYTLEEAMKASQYTARLSADQFRNAFEAGAGTETNAVDASTEDGKQTLTAALSSLGEHAEEAASAYEAGQDVSRFAAGMSEAAERYAITGADIRAQDGGIPAESVISTLTDEQVEKAQEIGGRLRETRAAAVSQLAEQRKAIRAQAQAIEQQGAADAAALTEVNRQIREANKLGRETVEMFEAQRDALTKAVEADPDFQNTEEYAKAFDEAKENMERAVELQKSVEELQARKKEIEGKAPVKRKKGTVSLDGGNIAGTDYAGIDRSKLTRQQQNIVAMVERLADFINIDYVVFDGPANMGGAYMQGGRLYININAGMTQEGRKSIAAASLSHELTHFMQEYAPDEYQELKDYVVKAVLKKSPAEFDRLVRQQRRWEPGKTYDELTDELVANACQTMLTDDKAVQRMARSNMTLAQKVADVLDEIGEKIRKAFEGLSFDEDRAIFAPVKAVMDEIDGITERWADGISAAVENYNAEQTVKNSVPVEEVLQDGKPKFQMIGEVEATDSLVAVHNKSVSGLRRMLQRGGVPFPSIAIKKAGSSHEGFGEVSIVFPRSTIDPAASRWNRLYSNDAWTPTEPRTEYDVGDTWKLQQRMEQEIGTEIYHATKLGSYLEKNQLERDLSTSEGDVVKALKGRAGIKYAYLKSIGQEPKVAQREKPLDGFGRYENAQLLAVFDSIPASELKEMDYDSTETLQKVADALNQQWLSSLPTETAQSLAGKWLLYSADKINPQIIKDALRNYENNGRAMESEVDDTDLERQLRDNKALEDDPKYQAWIRERFNGLIKDSGIPNGKGVYTDTGSRRSFKARHVPATLENIVQQMRKEQEKGIGLGGINLRGAATKAYRSVEEMRAESGKLLGARVFDEEYDSYMKEFGQRLNDLTETADKVGYDTAKQTLLEAVRDSKSKPDMQRRLQNESRWINYSEELADDLWQLRNDVQNMPAPYFEAKPRRVVSPDEALAYIIPDNAGSDIVNDLESRGYNVMTYKAGNEQDRLAKLNSVEGAQFQRFDDTSDDTASESRGRDIAYARLQSENAILSETVAAMKKITSKQDKTIAALQKRLQVTTTPEVRQSDARKLARQLIRENGSKADVERVSEQIKALGDYILQTETDKLSEDEIKNRARSIARDIVECASEQISIDDGTYSEIADNIKGRKLSIDEAFLGELDQAGGYDRFRKSLFGRLTIAKRESNSRESREDYTSVDQFYTDMQNTYGKAFFPDVANEGEQVQILAQMLDAGQPMEVNPYDQYMGEASEEIANQIVMDAMSGVLRAQEPTTMDKQRARTKEMQERIKQLKAEQKLDQREAASLYHTVYDLTVALDKAQSKYQTLRTEANYRAAQLRAEGTARAAEIKAAERERAAGQIAQLKAHYQEMRESAKARREESAGVTKYRKQVEKKAKKLYEMLMTNSNDLHVPEVLKAPLGEFLESLDFSSKRSLAGGEDTVADANFGARLVRIQQMLDNQQRYIDGDGSVAQDLGGYIDVSPEILEYLRGMAEMITTAMSTGRTFTVNQMTAADLKTLSDFMSNLRTAINNMNRFMANARYASVQTAAQADIERMKRLGKASEASASAAVRFAGWENGTPYYITKRLGPGAKSIFDGFAKGWERLAFNAQEIIDFTKNLYTDEEVRDWKRDIHDITLSDGSKVKMTTAQIMEFSQLLNDKQAPQHLLKGGGRIKDIKTKKGVITDTKHYHMSEEDRASILGVLTPRQLEVAKKLQHFMAVKGAEWGNEVSMQRFGYKFYTEGETYYPNRTDDLDRPMSEMDTPTDSMFRLLNLSSSHARNPKATNALVIGDIFDTFADHMSDMAKLNGMGLPLLDAIKWFNYKERINHEDGTYDTVTLQGAMQQAFGAQASRYFRTLIKDINGVNESGDRGTSLPSKMMSNYKIAAVAANLRVAFLQPTSYVRATTVLKPKHMIGILPSKAAYREAMKHSGTAVWKSHGYYDTDISKSMRQQITHDDSFKDKVADKSMALAELGDQATWSMLWQACKRQAKAESPALSHDALMEKTAALFREVVYSSQVMDSTLTRSEIMRGKTGWTKAMSAFMAEPTLSYNILMDAASELVLDVRENGKAGAWKRNSGKIGKAVSVYVASAAFAAVVESIADAIRDDDDEEFWEKFNQALWGEDGKLWTGNFMQDLTILGKIPYVKNFISTLQGYSSGDMSVAAFNNLVNVFNIWAETIKLNTGTQDKATKITYYGKMTEWGKVQKTLQALSQLSGFAVYNLTRDATAIWNTAMDVAGKQEWKIRTYDADRLSQSKLAAYNEYVKETGVSKRQFQSILTAADTSGNGSLTQDELGTELSRAVKAGEITNAQAEAIWKTKWNGENSKTFAKWSGAAAPSQGKATATGKTEKPAGSSMSFEDFKKTATVYDKEAVYNGYLQYVQPLGVNLADFTQFINEANTDGNSSVKQAELGEKLYEAVQSGQMTEEEANAWFLVFWNEPGSKTYTKWAAKNKK